MMNQRKQEKRIAFTGAVIVAASILALQAEPPPAPPPPPELPPHIRFAPPPHPSEMGGPGQIHTSDAPDELAADPYWRETVERGVEQFESDNPEVRRSAVMLLGKYPVAPAREVVGRALEDPDAGVRQAALVSVLEEPGQMYPPFADKIIRLLADPEVSIRRIASNSISAVIHSFPFTLQPGSTHMQRQLSNKAQRILREAYLDEDISVRRNMVDNYSFLRVDLPSETVIALLHDDDFQVAVKTLQWGLLHLSPAELSREVPKLAQHDNPAFRLELARALQSRRSPETLNALEALKDDPHPPVAIEAMLAIFNSRQDVELYQRIVNLHRESRGSAEVGQRIIMGAQMLGERGKPFLRDWLEDSNPSLRQQAAQIYLGIFGHEAEIDLLLSLLNDSVQGVRQQAVRVLMQSSGRLTAEHVHQMLSNRHVDVRRAAASVAAGLPAEEAEEVLLDLLLDDNRDVQVSALQQIGMRRIPGWEEILSISLRVEDPITKRTAMEWLIRYPTPTTLQVLRAYVEENPRSPLRPHIEAHLKRHQAPDPS